MTRESRQPASSVSSATRVDARRFWFSWDYAWCGHGTLGVAAQISWFGRRNFVLGSPNICRTAMMRASDAGSTRRIWQPSQRAAPAGCRRIRSVIPHTMCPPSEVARDTPGGAARGDLGFHRERWVVRATRASPRTPSATSSLVSMLHVGPDDGDERRHDDRRQHRRSRS